MKVRVLIGHRVDGEFEILAYSNEREDQSNKRAFEHAAAKALLREKDALQESAALWIEIPDEMISDRMYPNPVPLKGTIISAFSVMSIALILLPFI